MADQESLMKTGARFADETLLRQGEFTLSQSQAYQAMLERFGLRSEDLASLESLVGDVAALDNQQEALKDESPLLRGRVSRVRNDIQDWRGKLKLAALLAFQDSEPALLRQFRINRFDKQGLDRIARGFALLLKSARQHQQVLEPYGVGEAFIGRGEELASDLVTLLNQHKTVQLTLPEVTRRLEIAKGRLYLNLRRTSRIGQLAFYDDASRADSFRLKILFRNQASVAADVDDTVDPGPGDDLVDEEVAEPREDN